MKYTMQITYVLKQQRACFEHKYAEMKKIEKVKNDN